jgi:translation elongation factor EF-1alpha
MDLMKLAHKEYNLFENILEAIVKKKFNIEATSELISFLMHVHPMFHRKYAVNYILKLTDGILDYVNKGDDITIRNFSKERYEAVISSVREFLKRVKTLE